MTADQKTKGFPSLRWMWPLIEDVRSASEARKLGVAASALIGIASLVFSFGPRVTSIADDTTLGRIDYVFSAAISIAIAWGIWKYSRFAAVVGTTSYLIGFIAGISLVPHITPMYAFLGCIPLMAFVSSIRGTFAYHYYRKQITHAESVNSAAEESPAKDL
jgi:hypothetical protein